MKRERLAGLLDPHQLQLILLPTEDCNFRCTYCYEDFAIGRMSRATIDAVKRLIERRIPKLRELSISWFGGEPLIAKDIVMEINAFAKQCADHAGVSFGSGMTTNAYTLGRQTFRALLDLSVTSFQISLDGDAAEHDKTRKLRTGKGSFEKIWANLRDIRATEGDFHILLRVHVHCDNWASVEDLLSRIHGEFGSDQRFNVLLKAVGNWGGESVRQMKLLKNSSEAVAQLQQHLRGLGWYAAREQINPDLDDAALVERTEAELRADSPVERDPTQGDAMLTEASVAAPHACYAALPNSFVVRADGSLAKCTVAFSDTRNSIGKINGDGTLSIDNPKMQSFMRGFQSMDAGELHCPMKNMAAIPEVHSITIFPRRTNIAAALIP